MTHYEKISSKELRAGQVQFATKYNKVQTKRFVIESSQTTKIQF